MAGQGRGTAVEAVAGFGVHQNVGFQFLQRIADVAEEGKVGDKLAGGDASDLPH